MHTLVVEVGKTMAAAAASAVVNECDSILLSLQIQMQI